MNEQLLPIMKAAIGRYLPTKQRVIRVMAGIFIYVAG